MIPFDVEVTDPTDDHAFAYFRYQAEVRHGGWLVHHRTGSEFSFPAYTLEGRPVFSWDMVLRLAHEHAQKAIEFYRRTNMRYET